MLLHFVAWFCYSTIWIYLLALNPAESLVIAASSAELFKLHLNIFEPISI